MDWKPATLLDVLVSDLEGRTMNIATASTTDVPPSPALVSLVVCSLTLVVGALSSEAALSSSSSPFSCSAFASQENMQPSSYHRGE
jgi:hypothetical protein